jgi:hypothetical protein
LPYQEALPSSVYPAGAGVGGVLACLGLGAAVELGGGVGLGVSAAVDGDGEFTGG